MKGDKRVTAPVGPLTHKAPQTHTTVICARDTPVNVVESNPDSQKLTHCIHALPRL